MTEKVADGFRAVVDDRAADFREIETGVEGVRDRIGRVEIDFADHAVVSGGLGALKEIHVKSSRIAFSACRGRSHDTINVNEFVVAFLFEVSAKPEKIRVVITRRLVECDEQSVSFVDGGGVKGFADEFVKLGKRERGEFDSVVVVEGEKQLGGGVEPADVWVRWGSSGHATGSFDVVANRIAVIARLEIRKPNCDAGNTPGNRKIRRGCGMGRGLGAKRRQIEPQPPTAFPAQFLPA